MRFLYLLSLLFLAQLSLTAQEEFPDTESVETTDTEYAEPTVATSPRLEKIAARLQLTADQRPRLAAILATFAEADPPTTPEAKRAQRKALRSQVMQILTPEQKARIRQGRGKAGGPGKQGSKQAPKRNLLDVLIDDFAAPLLDKRKRKRGGG